MGLNGSSGFFVCTQKPICFRLLDIPKLFIELLLFFGCGLISIYFHTTKAQKRRLSSNADWNSKSLKLAVMQMSSRCYFCFITMLFFLLLHAKKENWNKECNKMKPFPFLKLSRCNSLAVHVATRCSSITLNVYVIILWKFCEYVRNQGYLQQ